MRAIVEVMWLGAHRGSSQHRLGFIMEVTVKSHCRDGHHREMLRSHVVPSIERQLGQEPGS